MSQSLDLEHNLCSENTRESIGAALTAGVALVTGDKVITDNMDRADDELLPTLPAS